MVKASASQGAYVPAEPGRTPLFILLLWLVAVMGWWLFAFLPLSPEAPAWLAAAQNACFGSLDGGLPNEAGWLMLTAAPLFLLAALAAIEGPRLPRALFGAWQRPWPRLALVLVCGVALVEAIWVAQRYRVAADLSSMSRFEAKDLGPLPADYPRWDKAFPKANLIDQAGNSWTPQRLAGKAWVLSFVFAHCKTVCPFMVRDSLAAKRAAASSVGALFVTLDPWRDTPRALPGMAKSWALGEDEWALSGPPDEVNAFLDKLEAGRTRRADNGDIDHSPQVFVVDAQGRLAYRFLNPSPRWLAEALHRAR